MPWATEFECDKCRRIFEVTTSELRYYVLPDGSRISCLNQPVWCHCCGLVTEGERIETLAALDVPKQECDAQDPSAGRIAWRKLRRSPPRCLRCGSTEIIAAQETAHPRCGGALRDRKSCTHETTDRFWTYDPEGVPLNHRWNGALKRWFARRANRLFR